MIQTYLLKNDQLEVHVLNYGAIIDKIYTKDKNGHRGNVVLSYQDTQDYIRVPGPYLNAAVGPYAGRIAYGQIDKRHFSINNGPSHLHGGFHNISGRYFHITQKSATRLKAELTADHGADGYIHPIHYEIDYEIIDDRLIITLEASGEGNNPLSLTNHLYFNLSGDLKRDALDHVLTADFKKMGYIKDSGAPEELADASGPFDFSRGKTIRENLESRHPQFQYTAGLDHPFLLNGPVQLYDPQSGRLLTLTSSAQAIVLYAGNYLEPDMIFQNGVPGKQGLALAMEPSAFPNGINLGIDQLTKQYKQRTEYRFSLTA